MSMAAVPQKLDSRYLEALGPLRPLVDDDSLTEIMVNGPEMVYVERKGKILLTDIRFDDEAHLMRVIDTIGAAVGRRIDSRTPLMDARLLDGSRVNAAIPPGRARRSDSHDSKVQQGSVSGLRPHRIRHADARKPPRSSRHACSRAPTSWCPVEPVPVRRRSSTCARVSSRSTSASSPSRMRPSCSSTRSMSAVSRLVLRMSTAKAASRFASWSSTRCACDPIASSSESAVVVKRSTCSRR